LIRVSDIVRGDGVALRRPVIKCLFRLISVNVTRDLKKIFDAADFFSLRSRQCNLIDFPTNAMAKHRGTRAAGRREAIGSPQAGTFY